MRKFILVLFILISMFLSGCNSFLSNITQAAGRTPDQHQASATVSQQPLSKVDWANFTYFSSCYGNTQPFHTHNGQAVNNGVHFQVYPPTYGDLTGDNQAEAIVPYQCSAADAMGERVFVFTGSPDHPTLLGDLPQPYKPGEIANVTGISVSNQVLHLVGSGYSPSAPHCCPDLSIKMDYRWTGNGWKVIKFQSSPISK